MRSKKSAPLFKDLVKKSSRLLKTLNLRLKKIPHAKGVIGAGVVGTVLVCFATAAMLVAARQPSESIAVDATRDVEVTRPIAAPAAQASQTTSQKKVPAQAQAKKAAVAEPAAVHSAAADTVAADPVATNTPAANTVAAVSSTVQESEAVTITGCLVRDDEIFRLKDTIGEDAPKSRSWKSGFLKKRSASIDIIDAPNSLRLSNYIGKRVTVTGLLEDREMRARSLKPASGSCS